MSTPLPPIPPMPDTWALAQEGNKAMLIIAGQIIYVITDRPSTALTAVAIIMAHWWDEEYARLMNKEYVEGLAYMDAADNGEAWRKLGGLEP
jgi:hypothetical protein